MVPLSSHPPPPLLPDYKGDWFSAVETAECPYILWFVWRDSMHTSLSAQEGKWSAVRVPFYYTNMYFPDGRWGCSNVFLSAEIIFFSAQTGLPVCMWGG